MTRFIPSLALAASVAIGGAAFTTAFGAAAQAASFDCSRTDLAPDEAAICADPKLNDADMKMTTLYETLRGLFDMGTRESMENRQNQWLAARASCGADTTCLGRAYDQRIQQLEEIYKAIPRPQ